jgi:dimethylargininase
MNETETTAVRVKGREIFVGLSTSTNIAGAQAVAKAFPEYSTSVVRVHAPAIHLKDCINVIQPEVLIVSKSPSAQRTFKVSYSNNTFFILKLIL